MRLKRTLLATAVAVAVGVTGAVAVAQPAAAASCSPGPKSFYLRYDPWYPYTAYVLEQAYLTSETSTTCTYYGKVYAYALGNKSYVGMHSHTIPRP